MAYRIIAAGTFGLGSHRGSLGSFPTPLVPIHGVHSASDPTGAAWGVPGIVVVESNGTIDFSPDGLSWTPRAIPGLDVSWQNVVWTGSMFMAVGIQGETAVSFNGLSWAVRQKAGVSIDATSLASNGDITVAAGEFGAIAWTVDGRRWVPAPSSAANDLHAVTWTGGRFIAVGDNGLLLESPDGRNWTKGGGPPLAADLVGDDVIDGRVVVAGQDSTVQVRLPSVPDADDPPVYRTVIPAVAHAPGVNGSFWNTSVTLASLTGRPALVWLRWIRRMDPPVVRPFVVSGKAVLNDVVSTLFGADAGSGALVIDSKLPVAATSRTAAAAAGHGPGQVVPGIAPLRGGSTAILPGLRGGPSFRTNIGFANLSGTGEHVTVTVFGGDGSRIRERDVDVEGWRSVQLNRILKGSSPAGAVWAAVTADGPFAAYASVIDNGTNDAATVVPVAVTPKPLVVPAVAHTSGYNGSLWRSSLDIVDPGRDPARVMLELLTPEGGVIAGGSIDLEPGRAVRIDDVLGERFPGHPSGAVRIRPEAGSIAAWSRTFDVTPAGTLGQGIPAVPEGTAAVPAGGTLMLAGLKGGQAASGWFHTNLGLVNTGDAPARLLVQVGTGDGAVVDRIVTVPANGWVQLLKVLQDSVIGPVAEGWVTITVTEGSNRILAWASVIDNTSGDPSYRFARKVVPASHQ